MVTRILIASMSALLLATATPANAGQSKSESKTEQAQYKQVALVKVEIKQESGKVIKNKGDILDWDSRKNVVIESDDKTHLVDLALPQRGENQKKIKIKLGYVRNNEAIIAPYEVALKLKKREVIRIEGGIAIAVTVIPKKVKVEPPPEETKGRKDKIDGSAENPLDGL